MTTIKGTSGDDNLTGTAGNDSFNLSQGGNDTVHGLGGNDVFSFGATFTAADSVDGGDGADTLKLDGDYSAGVTLGHTTLVSVEAIDLAAGFSYKLTTGDDLEASLTVNGSALTAGETLNFDGSAVTNGPFAVHGGLGDDSFEMGAHFTAADRFNGGGGNDSLFLGGANYDVVFGGSTIRRIGDLVLSGGHSYRFTENDNNVAAGATMNIDASALGAADNFGFNGSRESDGSFDLDAGLGQIAFAGSAQNDALFLGAGLIAADRIDGEGGSDIAHLGGADYNLAMDRQTLVSIENIHLDGGFDYHITSGGDIAADDTQIWDATALTASDTLSLNFIKEKAGSVIVDGGAAATTIIGSQQGDDFDFSVTGQGGFVASDHINGEAGYDRLQLDGDYTGSHALTMTNTTIESIEEIDFDSGHSYAVTIAADTVAAGASLKVNGSLLGAGDSLTFDGSAAGTTSPLTLIGGAGDDALTGGAGNDNFDLGQGRNTASGGGGDDTIAVGNNLLHDQIDGGAGNDTVVLDGNYAVGFSGIFTSVERLELTDGHNYTLEPGDPDLVYDGSGLSAAYRVYVDTKPAATGSFTILGGAGGDSFRSGKDTTTSDSVVFQGNGGSDTVILDGGSTNHFTAKYLAVSDSTSVSYDIVSNFNFVHGILSASSAAGTVTGIDTRVTSGTLSTATFDTDLASAIGAGQLGAHHAVLFTADAGSLSGDTFLIVDANGTAGYQAAEDLVIQLIHATGTLTTASFS
jgi:hypothetical protein